MVIDTIKQPPQIQFKQILKNKNSLSTTMLESELCSEQHLWDIKDSIIDELLKMSMAY